MNKKCSKCGVVKSLNDFYKNKATKDGRLSQCKDCRNICRNIYRKSNRGKLSIRRANSKYSKSPKGQAVRRRHHLLKKYKMTEKEYNERFKQQGGVCDICHQPEKAVNRRNGKIQNLCVDHCHDTEANRALLCDRCNRLIGMVTNIREAKLLLGDVCVNYLRTYRKRNWRKHLVVIKKNEGCKVIKLNTQKDDIVLFKDLKSNVIPDRRKRKG